LTARVESYQTWLGALLAPHPQFTIAPSFKCGKYLKLINLKTPQLHLTARMESYQTVCSSVRFAHLAPQFTVAPNFECLKYLKLNN